MKLINPASLDLSNEDISNLSPLKKGYLFEYDVWYTLDVNNIEYESNPQTWSEWNKVNLQAKEKGINTQYDVKVYLKDSTIKIECKFTSAPIYHSWFMRDWYPRDCDIIVTNCKWHVSYEDRKLLGKKGVKLLEFTELIAYLLKKQRSHNKCNLNRVLGFRINHLSKLFYWLLFKREYYLKHFIESSGSQKLHSSLIPNSGKQDEKVLPAVFVEFFTVNQTRNHRGEKIMIGRSMYNG